MNIRLSTINLSTYGRSIYIYDRSFSPCPASRRLGFLWDQSTTWFQMFPIDIYMVNKSAHCYNSWLSISIIEGSNHTRKLFCGNIFQDDNNPWTGSMRCKWCINKVVDAISSRLYCDECKILFCADRSGMIFQLTVWQRMMRLSRT